MKWILIIVFVAALTVMGVGLFRMRNFGKKHPEASASPTPEKVEKAKEKASMIEAKPSPTPTVIAVDTNHELPVLTGDRFVYSAGQPNDLGVTRAVYKGVARVEKRKEPEDFLVVTSAARDSVETSRFSGRVRLENGTYDAILTAEGVYRLGRSARGGRVESLEEYRISILRPDGSRLYIVDGIAISPQQGSGGNGAVASVRETPKP